MAPPDSPFVASLEVALHEAGAEDVRFATTPDELLLRMPPPVEAGVGIICCSPRSGAVLQLIMQLRQRGWRRLLVACPDCDDRDVRLAIATKVRCLIGRTVGQAIGAAAIAASVPGNVLAHGLSHREVEVLQGVADGHTNNEIGEILGLSGLTVKSHMARIARKTGTGDRAEMVAMAMRAGLVA